MVKSYKTPQKGSGWLAYQLEKPAEVSATRLKTQESPGNNKKIDSLNHLIDSLESYIRGIPVELPGKKGKKKKNKDDDEGEARKLCFGVQTPMIMNPPQIRLITVLILYYVN
jgi:hypothetical protein